jgi:hypothetical protein
LGHVNHRNLRSSGGFRSDRDGILNNLHWRDEAVAPARESFNEARFLGVVVEHLAQLLDVSIQTLFEVNKGIFGTRDAGEVLRR